MKKLNIKYRFISMAVFLGLGLTYSEKSEAIIPVTDAASLVENIAGNIQDQLNWAQEKIMMMTGMDMDALLAQMNIDNQNNAISNSIVRNGAAMQEVQNIEIIEQSIPDKDSADTATIQILSESATCGAAVGASEESKLRLGEHCQFDTGISEQIITANEITEDFIESCKTLTRSTSADPGQSGINNTMCTEATSILGVGTLDTLTDQEAESVKRYVQLISGVSPVTKRSGRYEEGSELRNRLLVKEMRREAARSLVQTSLSEIAYMRIGDDTVKFSPLHLLSEFDNERFLNVDWTTSVGNTNKDAQNSIMPSEILRKMAVMDSFLVHMSVLSYKQRLREEALNATRLALLVEPIEL